MEEPRFTQLSQGTRAPTELEGTVTTTRIDAATPIDSDGAVLRPVADGVRFRHGGSLTVLVVGLVLTGVLVWTSWSLNNHNESRLLNLQGKQVGLVLAAAIPSVQTPLELSAEAVQASNGDVDKFRQIMTANVQAKGGFSSASLWGSVDGSVQQLASVGDLPPASSSAQIRSLILRSFQQSKLAINELERGGRTYIGFALALPGTGERFAVYGERLIPANRRASVASNSAFSDLNYAIFLGPHEDAKHLLTTDISQFPIANPKTVVRVPFGDTVLTTAVTARTPLGGTLTTWLIGIFAILGVLLTLGAAWITERLVRRRRTAELAETQIRQLYGELGALYGEQRSIAETLQRALLPQTLPSIPGLEIVSRYVPGAQGVEVGGDWYSVVKLDDDRFFFAVGDVSGRGLDAAAIMAHLRYTTPAYALDGDSPSQILDKATRQLDIDTDGHFATALLGLGNVDRRELSLANAGHLNPYLLGGAATGYIRMPINVPLGVGGKRYEDMTLTAEPGSTLIAFTDGLVERREEHLDVGLQRLDEAIRLHADDSLEELVDHVMSDLVGDASEDDVAILAVRWS
jgi:serine phosphatase RsbU (regulator of sigma subunit)